MRPHAQAFVPPSQPSGVSCMSTIACVSCKWSFMYEHTSVCVLRDWSFAHKHQCLRLTRVEFLACTRVPASRVSGALCASQVPASCASGFSGTSASASLSLEWSFVCERKCLRLAQMEFRVGVQVLASGASGVSRRSSPLVHEAPFARGQDELCRSQKWSGVHTCAGHSHTLLLPPRLATELERLWI